MKRWISVGLLALSQSSFAQGNTTVLPLGLESRNGNDGNNLFRQTSDQTQLFTATATGWTQPVRISGIAFRVDNGPVSSLATIVPRIEIRFSTTSQTPSTMSAFYSANVGPDETLVFAHDNVAVSAQGGPGPNPFELRFLFDQSFMYDPHGGNLLFRVTTSGGNFQGGANIDQDSGGSGYAIVGGVYTAPFPGALVTEFRWTTIPEPSVPTLLAAGLILVCAKRAAK